MFPSLAIALAFVVAGGGSGYAHRPVIAPPALELRAAPGYPVWLADGWRQSKQPSGIAAIPGTGSAKRFLIADDKGELWVLTVPETGSLALEFVRFESPKENAAERKFDLEGLAVDPRTGSILAVSEGKTSRAWRVRLTERNGEVRAEFDEATPEALAETLSEKVKDANRGLEAVGSYATRLYFGIEGGLGREAWLAIFDGEAMLALHNVTATLGMASLTDAVALADGALLLDRDRDEVVRIYVHDTTGAISDHRRARLRYTGPGGVDFTVHSAEGMAVDRDGDLWITIDPWKYFPSSWERLSPPDRTNYRNLVPMLIRFSASDLERQLGTGVNPWKEEITGPAVESAEIGTDRRRRL